MRKIVMTVFILATITSVILASYGMHLYFGAYDVSRLLDVSLKSVDIESSDEADFCIKTVIVVDNPTTFALKLLHVKEKLYFNNGGVITFLGENFAALSRNPKTILDFSNVTVSIKIALDASVDKNAVQSCKNWFAEVTIVVRGIPLYDRSMFLNFFVPYP